MGEGGGPAGKLKDACSGLLVILRLHVNLREDAVRQLRSQTEFNSQRACQPEIFWHWGWGPCVSTDPCTLGHQTSKSVY